MYEKLPFKMDSRLIHEYDTTNELTFCVPSKVYMIIIMIMWLFKMPFTPYGQDQDFVKSSLL